MYRNVLLRFQGFLRSSRVVPEKNIPFYGYWAGKFLSFLELNKETPIESRVEKFLERLRLDSQISDWQVEQARKAVDIYTAQFLAGGAGRYGYDQIIDKLRGAIRIKHYSYATERSYIDWARRFFEYAAKIKDKDVINGRLDKEDVCGYLTHLAVERRVSSSTQNQAFNALLFLFREVLKIELKDLNKTVRAKRGPKLPVVFSPKEIQILFERLEGRDLLIVQLLYGSGLRLMELARIRVQDIDFDANLIFVRAGKEDKDRTTILPELVKEKLRIHLEGVKYLHQKDIEAGYGEVYLPEALEHKYPNAAKEWRWQYIFPASNLSVDPRSGKVRRHHINPSTIQKLVKNALIKAGIVKHGSVHTLRHSFATHLLMNGINIREIQELLGHKNIETTMIYTHVLRDMNNAPESPLDNLYKNEIKSIKPER
ncbi:MAG: integron integrase [Candidatus Omnitrophota bacterium]